MCSVKEFGESLAVTESILTMPRTKTENTKYLREWRKRSQNEKRFNKPLREYMELKYRDQYNEYCRFFKTLIENHPSAKDLTRTSTFRK